ncbi:MAG: FAD-dependent oxidoreductase [Deltaproteobacteria bacterium]|nr:FAD-dependent oxidoreductase [Deltaproteobacteria bacterium]
MRYVLVGGSAAAVSALEAIRSVDKFGRIDLFSDEKVPLFSRVLLPYYVAEELSKQLLNFRPADFFEENNVTAHIGVRVQEIKPDSKTVTADNGNTYQYDKLLLATGGNAIIPKLPGVDKEGISPLKTMQDAERIYKFDGDRAVVIGAGSIGVESCISLMRRGLRVTLLEQLGHVLPTAFDDEAAGIIRGAIEQLGIEVITGERAIEFTGNGRVQSVVTSTGEIECDNVVLSVGIRPAVELAEQAGIEIGMMGGITTDAALMTSCQDIYAAGDVCETFDIARNQTFVNAIWPMAVEQGHIAGLNMAGQDKQYGGSVRMNSIGNFIGIPAMSMGVTRTEECSYVDEECHFQEVKKRTKNTYKKIILKNGCIVGAIFIGVGQTQRCGIISILLRRQIDVSDFIQTLISNNLSFMDILPLLRRYGDKFTEPEYKELMDTGL